jgi:hypothetical protein
MCAAAPVLAGPINVIPADTSIFDMLTTLQTSNPPAYLAIVRPNNPPAGIGGFLFDIPGDEEVRLKSTITRHFVESTTPISDHIALDPEMVTLRGLVAELVNGIPTQPTVQAPPNPLPLLPVMQPPATPGQQEDSTAATTTTDQQTSALASQQSIYQYFTATAPNVVNLTRQNRAFLYFQQLWWGRQLMSVESPFGIWTNMAISEVRAVQSRNSRYISDFTVIFERIRVVGDITIQGADLTQNGNAGLLAPTNQEQQTLYNLFPAQ